MKLYEQAQQQAQGAQGAQGTDGANQGKDDNVVDAEYEEVNDDK